MRRSILLSCVLALAACARPVVPPAAPETAVPPGGAAEAGRLAYERVCAGCHEEGKSGAPRTGRPEDWAGRSRLWQAVLAEHARRGFLGMPARGGDVALSDREVQAAAEHMLSLTHPKAPAGS